MVRIFRLLGAYRYTRGNIATRASAKGGFRSEVDNIAVIQGNTSGLHAVLSTISKECSASKKGCVVLLPTYSPILDEVGMNLEPKCVELSDNYAIDYNKLLELAKDNSNACILLSIPHNPYAESYDVEKIKELCRTAEQIISKWFLTK